MAEDCLTLDAVFEVGGEATDSPYYVRLILI